MLRLSLQEGEDVTSFTFVLAHLCFYICIVSESAAVFWVVAACSPRSATVYKYIKVQYTFKCKTYILFCHTPLYNNQQTTFKWDIALLLLSHHSFCVDFIGLFYSDRFINEMMNNELEPQCFISLYLCFPPSKRLKRVLISHSPVPGGSLARWCLSVERERLRRASACEEVVKCLQVL